MPWNKKLYPANWNEIAFKIKQKSKWTCEQCGTICRRPKEDLFSFSKRIQGKNKHILDWANQTAVSEIFNHPQKFTLTVAHLDHNPANCDRSNLKALCAPCHCRYDTTSGARAIKKRLKAEREGQLSLI